jgi:hypothetical protein
MKVLAAVIVLSLIFYPRSLRAAEVTNPAILGNLQTVVERGGYGCPRVIVAHTLGDDQYGRPEFLVACAVAPAGAFYRVVIPPTGPAIVRPNG